MNVTRLALCCLLFFPAVAFAQGQGRTRCYEAKNKLCPQELREQLTQAAKSGRPVIVRAMTAWDRNCNELSVEIRLSQPPQHGTVCLAIEGLKIGNAYFNSSPQCLGRPIGGTAIIYTSHPGFEGLDELTFLRRLNNGQEVSVAAQIRIAPAPSGFMEDRSGAEKNTPQKPGPIPRCVQLVS
jgi:hypothetical protein